MKNYKAQSLAVVLVFLIVGTIIGFALYTRMIRDAGSIVDQRASTMANEVADTIVGLMYTLNYDQVKNEEVLSLLESCYETDLAVSGCRRNEIPLTGIESLEEIFFEMGLENVDLSGFSEVGKENYCRVELAIDSLSQEGVTIEQDETYSIFLTNVEWGTEGFSLCDINFIMTDLGNADGFVMSTFYRKHEVDEITSYKPYAFEDIQGFKYRDSGHEEDDNWNDYNFDTSSLAFGIDGDYEILKDGYKIDEVRFKSLGGASNLFWNLSGSCNVQDHLLVEVGVTCGDKYAGKSFILPEEYFAPPIFDYVLFQGKGDLVPGNLVE